MRNKKNLKNTDRRPIQTVGNSRKTFLISRQYIGVSWEVEKICNKENSERRETGKGGRSREEKNRGGRLYNTGVGIGFLWDIRYPFERGKHRIAPAFTGPRAA